MYIAKRILGVGAGIANTSHRSISLLYAEGQRKGHIGIEVRMHPYSLGM